MDKIISFIFLYLFMFILNKVFNKGFKHLVKMFNKAREWLERD